MVFLTMSHSFQLKKAKLLLSEHKKGIKEKAERMNMSERTQFLLEEIDKIALLNIELYEDLLEKDKAIREVLAEKLGFGKEYAEHIASQSFNES